MEHAVNKLLKKKYCQRSCILSNAIHIWYCNISQFSVPYGGPIKEHRDILRNLVLFFVNMCDGHYCLGDMEIPPLKISLLAFSVTV